ncbi:MAG: glycosyltransferase family 4 protein [Anaerolineae bacterium]
MHILMTTDTVGGVWTYAMELARALGAEGAHISLASMGGAPNLAQRHEAGRIGTLDLYESTYRLEWMEDPWQDVYRAGDWLLRLEEDLRPDLVHLNGYAHGALPWNVPVLVVGHSCVLSWWEAVRGEDAPPSWARYQYEVTTGLRAADMVVAPTEAMMASLRRHYGPLARARVVPNGCAPALFTPGAKEPFVLTAGRLWDEAKNVAALQAVAPRLEWPVYVAGAEAHPDGGRADTRNLLCLGHLPRQKLAAWYARAAIYAAPARYEPFGLSALEAGLSGCALVLGDISSLREVWGDAALFVTPDDERELEYTIEGLIQNPKRRAELAARARRRALQYSPERLAAGYLALYGELIEKVQPSYRIGTHAFQTEI